LFVVFVGAIIALGAAQYYKLFDITSFTMPIFQGFYATKGLFLIPVLILIGLYLFTFKYFKNSLFLDAGLSQKEDIATTENLSWLNQFGTLGTFLKNDIKLIKKNHDSGNEFYLFVLRTYLFRKQTTARGNDHFCRNICFRWILICLWTVCTELG
jgi:hypothetical protein